MREKIGQEKILTAALELFAQRGFHPTSVSDIAKQAGVSKGLLYNYFESKDEVLVTIITQASEQMFAIAETLLSQGSYEERLKLFLESYMNSLELNEDYLAFQLSLLFQPGLKVHVQEKLHERITFIMELTARMFREAGAEKPETLARRFVCELDGVAVHYLSKSPNFSLEEVSQQLFQDYKDIL